MTERENYLRVTSVLSPFSGIEFVPDEVLEPASARGTAVHEAIESTLKGFGPGDVPLELEGYLKSFELFWDSHKHALEGGKMELEKRLYCDSLKISGQIDLIVETPEKTYLFDWKTSLKKHKTWDLQAAGYFHLACENGYENTAVPVFVKLSKDGKKPALYKSENIAEDCSDFHMCLHLFRLFKMDCTREKRKYGEYHGRR